MQATWKNVHFR